MILHHRPLLLWPFHSFLFLLQCLIRILRSSYLLRVDWMHVWMDDYIFNAHCASSNIFIEAIVETHQMFMELYATLLSVFARMSTK